jgi:hypothetical protein
LTFSHDLVHFIGGQDDTNANLTRRILLLLESKPVGDRAAYDRAVRAVLERYLTSDHGWINAKSPSRVPRFLQNDMARYWRTVAVDFAYKQWTRDNEGWALRSAKLRMSRKLLYAAGLLYCFSLSDKTWEDSPSDTDPARVQRAIERLWSQTNRTPLDLLAEGFLRLSSVGPGHQAFRAYDEFLAVLQTREQRDELEALEAKQADHSDLYQHVRDVGRRFERSLEAMFFDDKTTPYPDLTRTYGVF